MNEEEFRDKVTRSVAEGGWSSIQNLVYQIPIEDLKDIYCYLLEDDEDDE
jgi:hypothetical protein